MGTKKKGPLGPPLHSLSREFHRLELSHQPSEMGERFSRLALRFLIPLLQLSKASSKAIGDRYRHFQFSRGIARSLSLPKSLANRRPVRPL